MKANCYKCKHRGTIPGDAHSKCNHPEVTNLKIEGNPHGVKNDWFAWPANFDPTWLVNCNGFVSKEKPQEVNQGAAPSGG